MLYRAIREWARPRALHRADHGHPRVLPKDQMERYCEVIAAIKLRTSNKQGRHLSTAEAIRLLEAYGIDTTDGPVRAPGRVKETHDQPLLEALGLRPRDAAAPATGGPVPGP